MTDIFDETVAMWPLGARKKFNTMRALILTSAVQANAGPIEESLKWGEPAWRPKRPKQGTTLRLCWHNKSPSTIALLVGCRTSISATMQEVYPTVFQYESNRALRLGLGDPLPVEALDHLVRLTFTYHRKP
ncbi:DUF1801 domain-containing protein [Sulfitobacter guttiformis]|uniref:YdhG-like domain-containing protein n=1 Tax=Sulfitobacter guttiformis TaxID=74349 RepID=A0A420DN56_9RHOB|nr:DUF1801 domain-containing protein [Sulfitobacter guttiformis]RKE95645.1 hypothetical protein C8N30_0182 [Sulfitobacter guttiformis]